MLVLDRTVGRAILHEYGYRKLGPISNEKMTGLVRFATGDQTAQVTSEFTDGFLKGLQKTISKKLRPMLRGTGRRMTKTKRRQVAGVTVGRKHRPPTLKKPGVCAFIVEKLKAASQEKPVTKDQIFKAMKVRFPGRDKVSMRNTLDRMTWWVREDFGLVINKLGKGYWIDNPAAPKRPKKARAAQT